LTTSKKNGVPGVGRGDVEQGDIQRQLLGEVDRLRMVSSVSPGRPMMK
jgi:hypothetical protein